MGYFEVIVLDTCAIIWDALDSSKLSPKAINAIELNTRELIISDISIWEISMLIKKRRLVVDDSASGFVNLILQSRNFLIQEITPEIAELSVNFGSEINNDPADRLIAATSVLGNAPVVTADENLRAATMLETIW
ncbi:type II toxin-antitoxin system VapC family toxin [Pseudomonadota bacterium]